MDMKNPKYLVIALVGKAGVGKDTLARDLADDHKDWNMIVSCTTRPPRDGEKEGEAYHFLTNEQFAQKVLDGDMLEATCFNGWHYGTMKSSLVPGVNIGVFNPEGYDCLMEMPIAEVKVHGYLIQCEDKTRLLRQLNREEHPDVNEIIRRWLADDEDFYDIEQDERLTVVWNETPYHKMKICQKIESDARFAGFD